MLAASRSLEVMRRQAKRGFVPQVDFAREYILLGQPEAAMAWLERSFADREVNLAQINCDPEYAPLRADPRYQDLRRRMGLR